MRQLIPIALLVVATGCAHTRSNVQRIEPSKLKVEVMNFDKSGMLEAEDLAVSWSEKKVSGEIGGAKLDLTYSDADGKLFAAGKIDGAEARIYLQSERLDVTLGACGYALKPTEAGGYNGLFTCGISFPREVNLYLPDAETAGEKLAYIAILFTNPPSGVPFGGYAYAEQGCTLGSTAGGRRFYIDNMGQLVRCPFFENDTPDDGQTDWTYRGDKEAPKTGIRYPASPDKAD
jgi:hypothetical protein